ncbi:hypothetical protein GE09DRAFT_510584 [Coniochaeta sp. 2T2.1]|nr:hypothetical protein GE09DRAFT_510584 [Coniochaeta sp. 2T2.1]
MISTLTMHVQYGRSTNVSDNASWRPTASSRRTSEPWRSVWRTGYDGPWSTTSDLSGARNSLEKPPELTRSRSSVDNGSSNSATGRLRRLKQRTKGRYRRVLNVSEVSQQDSPLPPGRMAVELDRLDEMEDESAADGDRPRIPYTTCPKSAPAVLLSPYRSISQRDTQLRRRLSMPARSLSSQSYRALPLYSARKDVVADKIRSLGRILRRTESSSLSNSVTEFPTPLDGRERRRQARNSYEMHSDSVTSSPLFNTPTSESAFSPTAVGEGIFYPLVRAGTLVATAELDRLCFLANAKAPASTPSDKGPTATGNPSSALASPHPQTDGITLPAAPANTPASDTASPGFPTVSRPSQHGNRRKASRSRLSEVHNQEDTPLTIERAPGSTSVIGASPDPNKSGTSHAGNDVDKCERHDIYRGLVPEPLVPTPSPLSDMTGRGEASHSVRFQHSSAQHPPQKKLDMENLNELLDNAIGSCFVAQRLSASTITRSNPGGATVFGHRAASSDFTRQLKLLDHEACLPTQSLPLSTVGIRPFIDTRASSPGPRREQSTRDLSSLSAACPIVKKHMARHMSRSTTPVEPHAVPCKPADWSPDRGNEPGDSDPFCSPGNDQVTDVEATKQGPKARRNTSGTVLITDMDDTSEGSTSGTESSVSASDRPVADDGCPQAFARMKELEERERLEKKKHHSIMAGKMRGETGSAEG